MDCERHAGILIDVALGAPASAEFQAHLEACGPCRARLDEERRRAAIIDSVIRGALRVEPSPDLTQRVRRRLGERRGSERADLHRWWPLAVAAALLACLLALSRAERTRETPRPTVAAAPSAAPTPRAGPAVAAVTPTPRVTIRPATVKAAIPRPPLEPELIVPPGQKEALQRFVAALRNGQVDAPLARVTDMALPAPLPAPLEIQPIDIRPLATGSVPETRSES